MKYSQDQSFLNRVNSQPRNVPNNYYFQEEAKDWKFPKFLPGHVFTFNFVGSLDSSEIPTIDEYFDPKKLKNFVHQKPFFDHQPIGLSLGRLSSGPEEYFMDLKAMPKQVLNLTLQYLFRVIHPAIEKFAITNDREMRPLEERMKNFDYLRYFFSINAEYFRTVLGNDIFFWVNKYNTSQIRNVQLIDFDVLEKLSISNYNYDKSIQINGSTLEDVQQAYITKLKNRN